MKILILIEKVNKNYRLELSITTSGVVLKQDS